MTYSNPSKVLKVPRSAIYVSQIIKVNGYKPRCELTSSSLDGPYMAKIDPWAHWLRCEPADIRYAHIRTRGHFSKLHMA